MKTKYTVQKLRDNNMILFECITGSRAYGTNLPESDTDIRGVFIQPMDDILGFGYVEQVSDKMNDVTFYEIRRFLQLLANNNPNILELLNTPDECVISQHPLFDLILDRKDEFITKQCRNTFGGYAVTQIKKSRGYDKKSNWDKKEMVRKNVLDFCYVFEENKTIPFNDWISDLTGPDLSHNDFGLAALGHTHGIYGMYFMYDGEQSGIVSHCETANDVRVVSIPKDRELLTYLSFNKDAYSTHCRRFKEYQTWVKERNPDRFKMNKEHGKNYDSKNMMHTFRLLNMALELADGEINVRRGDDELKTLMAIRRGEFEFDDLIVQAEALIVQMDEKFENSTLPDSIDPEFINSLLLAIRKEYYDRVL